ncbi:MAG: hypothetical protein U9N30_00960 [Campylobacterota bacterium]|nr:hypothetical protein [Campylobacterota bacterium]
MNNITVKDLIQKLSTLPEDIPLVIDGYEDGLDMIVDVELINIEQNTNSKWWNGCYTKAEKSGDNAVYLLSTRRSRI